MHHAGCDRYRPPSAFELRKREEAASATGPDPRQTFRTGKDTGLDHVPSVSLAINQAWCVAAMIATDLLCWMCLLGLSGELTLAEPKTLRYRLLHTAARFVRGQRKRKIKLPGAWPWVHGLAAAFHAAFALTALRCPDLTEPPHGPPSRPEKPVVLPHRHPRSRR